MKNRDLDKKLGAYLDGALADAKRERFERRLAGDTALQKQLKRSQALSGLVHEAWTEGPAAPAPEFLIASIRPHIAAISRERRARPIWQQRLEQTRMRFVGWFSPMPLATSAVAAFLLAVAFLPRPEGPIATLVAQFPPTQAAPTESPITVRSTSTLQSNPYHRRILNTPFAPANSGPNHSAAIYDVSPGENPAMLLQNEDGSTVLWLLEDDDLSLMLERMDRWG